MSIAYTVEFASLGWVFVIVRLIGLFT